MPQHGHPSATSATAAIARTLAAALGLAAALTLAPASADEGTSRVIISTTLNDTLQLFDASSLAELQPPLPSKGGGPVRLWVQEPYLFAANHGVALGSVGVFDLSGDLVTELPLSPFPTRPGSVGITATDDAVYVTNAYQALAGCDVPNGSVTVFDASRLPTLGALVEEATVELSGAQPWAVSVDPSTDFAFASTNCGDAVDTLEPQVTVCDNPVNVTCPPTYARTASRATTGGPDATIWDPAHGLNLTVTIGGNSVSVHDAASPDALTSVPLPGAGPIDATLADTRSGRRWFITANGADDSISIVDRDLVGGCVDEGVETCEATIATIGTAVPGGAPEGVAYDPVTNRAFVVNKTFPPTLSVIQLTEHASGAVTGQDMAQIDLNALGTSVPIPGIIAFDVVVQTR